MTHYTQSRRDNAERHEQENARAREIAQRALHEAMTRIRHDIADYEDMVKDDIANHDAQALVKHERFLAGLKAALRHLEDYGLL
jgi:hypothetical protein